MRSVSLPIPVGERVGARGGGTHNHFPLTRPSVTVSLLWMWRGLGLLPRPANVVNAQLRRVARPLGDGGEAGAADMRARIAAAELMIDFVPPGGADAPTPIRLPPDGGRHDQSVRRAPSRVVVRAVPGIILGSLVVPVFVVTSTIERPAAHRAGRVAVPAAACSTVTASVVTGPTVTGPTMESPAMNDAAVVVAVGAVGGHGCAAKRQRDEEGVVFHPVKIPSVGRCRGGCCRRVMRTTHGLT